MSVSRGGIVESLGGTVATCLCPEWSQERVGRVRWDSAHAFGRYFPRARRVPGSVLGVPGGEGEHQAGGVAAKMELGAGGHGTPGLLTSPWGGDLNMLFLKRQNHISSSH